MRHLGEVYRGSKGSSDGRRHWNVAGSMRAGNQADQSHAGRDPAREKKVQKVREFRRRAKECRESAAKARTSELKQHYETLASVWDRLAKERLDFFVQHPESDIHSEVDGDKASAE